MTTMTPDRPAGPSERGMPAAMPLLRTSLATRVPREVEAGAPTAPAMTARDFRFSYGGPHETLKGITLDIARKAVTAIIGPSGCGKSTFLRSINRLHDLVPTHRYSGDIQLEGSSIFSSGTDLVTLRQRVGMVFQRPNPFPKTIFENVAYGPALNRLVAKRDLPDLVERCLRKAALWDEVKDRLDEIGTGLSGGQQQRLCIARTIAVRPDVILFDEPTSALDPRMTAEVLAVMADLAASGQTMIVVTHAMNFARRAAKTVHVFHEGVVAESGPPEQIFDAPSHPATREFLHECTA